MTERERQRQQTRRRLYEAALHAFRTTGVSQARVDDIAAAAGVSRATFYFHFPTKDDVLLDLLRTSQAQMAAELEGLHPEATLEDALRCVARKMALQWKEEPLLLAEIGMVAIKRTAQNLQELEGSFAIQTALVPWFENAAADAHVDPLLPPILLSEFFLVNLFGAALAWCGNPCVELQVLLDNVVIFFLRAAASAPESIQPT